MPAKTQGGEAMGRISNKEDTGIYIIDAQYRIVYFNDKIRQTFPFLCCGERCYEALCREEEPCRDCPVAKDEAKSGVLYNKAVSYTHLDVYKRQPSIRAMPIQSKR